MTVDSDLVLARGVEKVYYVQQVWGAVEDVLVCLGDSEDDRSVCNRRLLLLMLLLR